MARLDRRARLDGRPGERLRRRGGRGREHPGAGGRDGVIEQCLSRLLTHGEPTERAVVLVHGLTNCPKQWELFGQEAYERGWNVLILRLPEHGLGDRETGKIGSVSHLRHLDAQKLARYADQAIDIGVGLGEKTDVMGLSLGGTVAAWSAQERTTSTASS